VVVAGRRARDRTDHRGWRPTWFVYICVGLVVFYVVGSIRMWLHERQPKIDALRNLEPVAAHEYKKRKDVGGAIATVITLVVILGIGYFIFEALLTPQQSVQPDPTPSRPRASDASDGGGNAWNERPLKKGDSVSVILREMGATADDVEAITAAFGGLSKDTAPRDGYKLRVLLAPASDGKRLQPVRVIIATNTTITAIVARTDRGEYLAVDPRANGDARGAAPQPSVQPRPRSSVQPKPKSSAEAEASRTTEEQVSAERLFASVKLCIFNSLTSNTQQGETSETAMRIAATRNCARPYRTYIANSMCKDPSSPGCDNPELANEAFAMLIKSVFDDMLGRRP